MKFKLWRKAIDLHFIRMLGLRHTKQIGEKHKLGQEIIKKLLKESESCNEGLN